MSEKQEVKARVVEVRKVDPPPMDGWIYIMWDGSDWKVTTYSLRKTSGAAFEAHDKGEPYRLVHIKDESPQ